MFEFLSLLLVLIFGVTIGVGFYFGGLLGEYLESKIKQKMGK